MAKDATPVPLFKDDYEKSVNIEKTDHVFYYKDSTRKIVPSTDDEVNNRARIRLNEIKDTVKNLPQVYLEKWGQVKLYGSSGDVDNATGLLLNIENGAYDIKNKLNHMTGKEWTKFTCSWFIFNALQSDLKEEREVTQDSQSHPATFSPTMTSEFVRFFTKEGQRVLDPFAGIGSTLVACRRTGRVGYGIELNPKYFEIIRLRVPEFKENIYNDDSRNLDQLGLPEVNYSISSPPYWDVLNRSTDGFMKDRVNQGLDVKYSESNQDLGNIKNYHEFVDEVCSIYFKLYNILSDGAYITIIVKNVKKGGRLYPLAWDMARILGEKYVLKDERIWIQDKISLSPYGYPHVWASNIIHHYCLNLRKE